VIKEHEAKVNKKEEKNNSLDCTTNEEVVQSYNNEYIIEDVEQLESSQQLLLESYEEEEDNAKSYIDFINSLGDKELCNLDNAMEGLDIITNDINSQVEEKICRYASGKYKLKAINNTDREILAVINAINAFRLYLGFKEFTVRTDCEAICKYYNKVNSKKSSTRRWVLFEDIITGNGYKVIFEHIKGKDNTLPDIFSRSSILQE
jgi:hypothetical protein